VFALGVGLLALGCGDGPSEEGARAVDKSGSPQIAFFRARAGDRALYDVGVTDARGRNVEILTGDSVKSAVWPQLFTDLSWSPKGDSIAFIGGKAPGRDGPRTPTDLFIAETDGSAAEQVSHLGDVSGPVFAPDGRRIVFTRIRFTDDRLSRGELWSISPSGSELTKLTERKQGETDVAGSFSPDGSRLAVTRANLDVRKRSAHLSVHVLKADGSGDERVIDDAVEPEFSPDGKRIAFTSSRDRNGRLCYGDACSPATELYVARADGTSIQRLTKTRDLNEATPSWLPGGLRIVYQRGEVVGNAQGTAIFEINADGSCVRKLLRDPELYTWYASPAVYPGSSRLRASLVRC
jgi:Tol biopolymer transport system component